MLMFFKSRKLFLWRVFLSGLFTYLLNIFLKEELEYSFIFWIIVIGISFLFIDNLKMQKIIDFINNEKFSKRYRFLYRCLLLDTFLSISSSLIVIIVFYKSAPETPVSIILAGFFFAYLALVYVYKYFNKNPIPLCDKQGDINE